MNKIKYFFLKNILKKEMMQYKINEYRKKGAVIGEGVRTFSPIISSEPYLIKIGNNVTISDGVKFTTHDNSIIKVCNDKTDVFGRITVGDNCFIGQNTIFLPGVELGSNNIVGAGSIITKSFPTEGNVIAGNPAKVIGTVAEYKNKYYDNALNTKGMSTSQKRLYLENNSDKLFRK